MAWDLAALGAAMALAWWPVLRDLAVRWSSDPQYAHGFFVPLFSLYLVYEARQRLMGSGRRASWWGLLWVAVGLALMLPAAYPLQWLAWTRYVPKLGSLGIFWLEGMSVLPALAGLALLWGGRNALRVTAPAIAFLAFMVPLPDRLLSMLSQPLQGFATVVSTYLLQTLGMLARAEGNIIRVGDQKLNVAEACNGLGMLISFLAFAAAAAMVVRRPLWQRLAVVVGAVPIALATNVLRITVTGTLHVLVRSKSIDAIVHDVAGWLMSPLALGMLWLELFALSRLTVSAAPSRGPHGTGVGLGEGLRTRFNVRFAATLVGATVLAWAGLFGAHWFQTVRQAGSLIRQADRWERAGQTKKAAEALSSYLKFRPGDADAAARLALLLEKEGGPINARVEAFQALKRALRLDPGRTDVRERAADLVSELGDQREARVHLEALVKAKPGDRKTRLRYARTLIALGDFSEARAVIEVLSKDPGSDGEIESMRGRCDEGQGRFARALDWYVKAVERDPTRVDDYVAQARLLRQRLDQVGAADRVMNELVAANPKSARAHLARGLYRKEYGLDGYAADLERARVLDPEQIEVVLATATVAAGRGDAEGARDALRIGLRRHPENARLYLSLAGLVQSAGRLAEAEAVLKEGLAKVSVGTELRLALAEMLIRRGRLDQAKETVARLRRDGVPAALLDYLEAGVHYQAGRWAQAAYLLERIPSSEVGQREVAGRIASLLGLCYEQLGQPNQRLAAYRRALSLDPQSTSARVAVADALLAVGRRDDALAEYRRAAPRSADAALAAARLLIVQNLREAEGARNWDDVETTLKDAERLAPGSVEVAALRAETLAGRGQTDEAERLLKAARRAHPDEVMPWIGLARLAERVKGTQAALTVVGEAAQELGDRVDLRLERARLLVARGGDQVKARLDDLSQGVETFPEADRWRLVTGIARYYAQSGDPAAALALAARHAGQAPNGLDAQLTVFDLAVQAGDKAAMAQARDEARRIEGEKGVSWRFATARLILWEAERGDKSRLPEARSTLAEVAAQQPAWPRVPLALAQIDELEEKPTEAVRSYLRAIDLGERDPEVVRRVLTLLAKDKKFVEINQVLAKLQNLAFDEGRFQRLAAEVVAQNRDYGRAVELARKAVTDRSGGAREHLWLGEILWLTGRKDESLEALRRATGLAGADPIPWVAYTKFLAMAGRKDEAEAAAAEAERQLPQGKEPLALAQCYESAGLMERAEKLYREAFDAGNDDVEARRGLVEFLLRVDRLTEAEALLERALANSSRPGDADWARRTMAVAMTRETDPARVKRAIEVLGLQQSAGPVAAVESLPLEELRTRARVLAAQEDSASHKEAVRLMEEVVRRGPVIDGDLFLLARLQEAVDNWPRARELLANLVSAGKDSPTYTTYLAILIETYLRRELLTEAKPYLEELTRLEPRSLRTATMLALRLKIQGKAGEAVAMLQDYARDNPETPIRELYAILKEVGGEAAFEATLRRLIDEKGRADARLALIEVLAVTKDRTADAIDACEQAWDHCPPEAVAKEAVFILLRNQADAGQRERVALRMRQAVAKSPDSTPLREAFATLMLLQSDAREAITQFRAVCEKDPENVAAMNNLAWLLAVTGDRGDEALQLVDRAVSLAGPTPELLDTRALVHMARGQGVAAVQDLQKALAAKPSPPILFHLSRAYAMQRDLPSAREALRKAQGAGFKPTALLGPEQPSYRELLARLGL